MSVEQSVLNSALFDALLPLVWARDSKLRRLGQIRLIFRAEFVSLGAPVTGASWIPDLRARNSVEEMVWRRLESH